MEAKELLDRLRRDGLTIAVAESCTGGLLSHRLVAVPGASKVFRGGIVAYHDDLKSKVLGVDAGVIEKFGAVSAAVAEAMAHRDLTGADMGVGLTGVAGPTGATPGKSVGTVWFAVIGPRKVMMVHKGHFDGDRVAIQTQAVDEAVELAMGNLLEAEREGQVQAS